MDAGQPELLDVVADGGINLARQIDEASFGIGVDARCQLVERNRERVGERFPAAVQGHAARVVQLFRVGPDGVDRHADRQRTTGAIADHAARGRHRLHAQRAQIALFHQLVRANDLQPGDAGEQTEQRQ